MENLQKKRASTSIQNPKVGDYAEHFRKCKLGNSVLDVGCGDMNIKKYCPNPEYYYGLDAFPIIKGIISRPIEEYCPNIYGYETIVCFAALDNVYNLKEAVRNMKRLCRRNIILLTGIGIPVDDYHTFEITEQVLNGLMGQEFKQSYREELAQKIFLLEYSC